MRCERYEQFEPLVIAPGERVFVLTGAEVIASPQGWRRDPQLVWQFYSQRRAKLAQVQPNAAHIALAQLEQRLGERLFLCTQNVDDLHERGGSQRVTHMHGELSRSRCER